MLATDGEGLAGLQSKISHQMSGHSIMTAAVQRLVLPKQRQRPLMVSA